MVVEGQKENDCKAEDMDNKNVKSYSCICADKNCNSKLELASKNNTLTKQMFTSIAEIEFQNEDPDESPETEPEVPENPDPETENSVEEPETEKTSENPEPITEMTENRTESNTEITKTTEKTTIETTIKPRVNCYQCNNNASLENIGYKNAHFCKFNATEYNGVIEDNPGKIVGCPYRCEITYVFDNFDSLYSF